MNGEQWCHGTMTIWRIQRLRIGGMKETGGLKESEEIALMKNRKNGEDLKQIGGLTRSNHHCEI